MNCLSTVRQFCLVRVVLLFSVITNPVSMGERGYKHKVAWILQNVADILLLFKTFYLKGRGCLLGQGCLIGTTQYLFDCHPAYTLHTLFF